jgi:hypothetical protein
MNKQEESYMEESKEKSFQFPCTISAQTVSDTLCSAFEGGSHYWCLIHDRFVPKGLKKPRYVHDVPLTEGGFLVLMAPGDSLPQFTGKFTEDKHDMLPAILDRKAITRGLQVMFEKYPRHFANMVGVGGDAETGDVFLQCCIFGEIIFG